MKRVFCGLQAAGIVQKVCATDFTCRDVFLQAGAMLKLAPIAAKCESVELPRVLKVIEQLVNTGEGFWYGVGGASLLLFKGLCLTATHALWASAMPIVRSYHQNGGCQLPYVSPCSLTGSD